MGRSYVSWPELGLYVTGFQLLSNLSDRQGHLDRRGVFLLGRPTFELLYQDADHRESARDWHY